MKRLFIIPVILLFSQISFAVDSSYWRDGFIQGRDLFYNLDGGVFKVYGKNLNDVKLSLGENSSEQFSVYDFKILRDQVLFLNKIKYDYYCQSYSLTTFKQTFNVPCAPGSLNVSPDQKYFAVDWYGKVASCTGPDKMTDLPIYSAKSGKAVSTVQQICGRLSFGENNKAYSFQRAKERTNGFLRLSLLEINIETNQVEILYDKLNSAYVNVEDIASIKMAWDGRVLGFVAHFQTWYKNEAPGSFSSFYIFNIKQKTFESFGADVYGTGFMTNSGFFKSADGDFIYRPYKDGTSKTDPVSSWGAAANFTPLNDEIMYSNVGYDRNKLVVAKYNSQTSLLTTTLLPTSDTMTSAFNSTTLKGKNIFYLSNGKLFMLDMATMTSRTVLQTLPPSDVETRVSASDDQSVVLIWTHMKGKPTFRFYNTTSGALIAERTNYDGEYNCENLSSLYALSVKVSAESRKALIQCGADRSIALVTY
ncbi:MAG: hypothetical protein H7326_03270 [Bdellovibrionaceae bacterium]|nr:hypothetical protein [Pseudobdellovibrionaceae bacterium]